MNKCNFCGKVLATKYTLKSHQEKAIYCLKIQAEGKGKEIEPIKRYIIFWFVRLFISTFHFLKEGRDKHSNSKASPRTNNGRTPVASFPPLFYCPNPGPFLLHFLA